MLIESLNKVAKEYYSKDILEHNHSKYLEDCFKILYTFFEQKLGDTYLFSALTYNNKHSEADIKTVPSGTSNTDYHFAVEIQPILEPVINDLLEDLKKKGDDEICMSLTFTLLQNSTEGTDLFLKSGNGYESEVFKSHRPKTDIFQISSLKFDENFEVFIRNDENQRLIAEFGEIKEVFKKAYDDNKKFGRLLWQYMRLESLCKNKNQSFFVHFIRPSFIDFGHNVLLSLATNKTIDYQLLLIIDLLVYRIASQMAIEKIKEIDKIENLKLVSNSIHAIKTGTNILLSPALESLGQMKELKDNYLVKVALDARDQLIAITEIINLISKLSSKNLSNLQKKEELINSRLFSAKKDKFYLSKKLQEISDLNSKDGTKPNAIPDGDINIVLDENFLSYEGTNPTELFYLFLLITIFENCIKHGELDINTQIKVTVYFDTEKKVLEFTNESESENKFDLTYENSTGYINFLFFIFKELDFGKIECGSENKLFRFKIMSK